MVTISGTTLRPRTHDQLRALNEPVPITVAVSKDRRLRSITLRGQQHAVRGILDTWEMEDEWWRNPTLRRYYLIETISGSRMTIFRDCLADRWYRQDYPYPTGD